MILASYKGTRSGTFAHNIPPVGDSQINQIRR
jgi:hypothetical protein